MEREKKPEELFGIFLEMMEKDGSNESSAHIFKVLGRFLFDLMDFSSKGFVPVLNFTIFGRKMSEEETDVVIRITRTDSNEAYEAFGMEKFQEILQRAWGEYGREVWGMTPVDEREDMRINTNKVSKVKSEWRHLMGEKDGDG